MFYVYGENIKSDFEAKWGRESIEDDSHSGQPVSAATPEMSEKVKEFIMQDRRVTVSRIAEEMGIPTGTVHLIMHNHLEMSREDLELLRESPTNFFMNLVNGDETWIYHRDPESKMESIQWKHKTSPIPKKLKAAESTDKVMADQPKEFFWRDNVL
ncbi:hypothetical protein ILUMI_04731 [Ignelater luminosus]|uniref:Uncharacterized protein n=1 Tax=Ignelater luminosus TaxID=2038154 RepID=A0A8K0GE97_IGNLU|nr:hypothetical protein ILUMI_04731 [Ignelater luminosus]